MAVAALFASLWLAAACKKPAPPPEPTTPGPPASTAAHDALWKLAPASARLGVVVSPRAIALIERGAVALESLLTVAPELAQLHDRLRAALPAQVTAVRALADYGLTRDKGFAMFLGEGGDSAVVVPVADRDRFVTKTGGTRGGDTDTTPKGAVCKLQGAHYVCVTREAMFEQLGRSGLDDVRTAANVRGDIELAVRDLGRTGSARLTAAVQIAPGALVVRGSVERMPAAARFGDVREPLAESASAAGFGVFELGPWLRQVPALPLAKGVTTAELARSFAGPVMFRIPAGTRDLGIRIPLRDPAPATTLVAHCADVPQLSVAGAVSDAQGCRVTLPDSKVRIDGWVDGNELRVGTRDTTGEALPPSPLAQELAAGKWSHALFGRGVLLDAVGLSGQVPGIPSSAQPFLRLVPLVNELGTAIRRDGDNLHFVLGIRTVWTNPTELVAKILAVSAKPGAPGELVARIQAIADAAPGSLFAHDHKAGATGIVAFALPLGVVAAIAIPAFMDYQSRAAATPEPSESNR